MYDLEKYPEHLRGIVRVLLENEDSLSDGFGYYLFEDDGEQWRALCDIAQQIYDAVEK